jgi:hypothetical protein
LFSLGVRRRESPYIVITGERSTTE